ncbi:MAG: hypothetical protein V7695_13950 [Sulfitobacter sp.]
MTIANWIAVVLPVVGVVGAALLYTFQRSIDRAEIMLEEKKDAYRCFLDALFEHAEHRTAETRKSFDKSKIKMLLVAPDKIIKELVSLQEMATMDMDATGPGDVHNAATRLILVMRKDCFDGSTLISEELDYVVPIGKPTPLTAEPEGHYEP